GFPLHPVLEFFPVNLALNERDFNIDIVIHTDTEILSTPVYSDLFSANGKRQFLRLDEDEGTDFLGRPIFGSGNLRHKLNVIGKFPVIQDRKSTRLNSSHGSISYAVFCLKK